MGGIILIILIAGGSHTGKTLFAQKLLEQYHYPYLSIDHLKMGLIRSGYCSLTPESDDAALTRYLWPVVREIIKTAIENRQNLIVEGCYIPFDFQADFPPDYLSEIQYVCLVLGECYIENHYRDILQHASEIEHRGTDDSISKQTLLKENRINLEKCMEYGLDYVLINNSYVITWEPRC